MRTMYNQTINPLQQRSKERKGESIVKLVPILQNAKQRAKNHFDVDFPSAPLNNREERITLGKIGLSGRLSFEQVHNIKLVLNWYTISN